MNLKKLPLTLLFILFLAGEVWAQNRIIIGRVLDPTGQPAIGATIVVKGDPLTATVTDLEGRYTLTVPEGAVLVVFYTGAKTMEVAANQDQLEILLYKKMKPCRQL